MLWISTMEDPYHYALKEKDKLKRKQQSNPRGRERWVSNSKDKHILEDESKPKWNKELDQRAPRKGSSSKEFRGTFLKCGENEHRAFKNIWKCLNKQSLVGHEEKTIDNMVEPEKGESLMLKRIMFSKKGVESIQKTSLFRTVCKLEGKYCKVIMDGISTDNLVSKEMVQNLFLKRLKYPYPYWIIWFQYDHVMEVK